VPTIDPIIRAAWESSTVRNRAQPFDSFLRERILTWSYTDKASGADEAKLTLMNNDLALFDIEALRVGNRLYVQWGYPHAIHPTRAFTIKKIRGFTTLSLEGEAADATRVIGVQRTRTWENVTEFDVADFHFHPPSESAPPVVTLTYWESDQGDFIGEPSIEQNIQGRPGRVQRRGRNNRERTDVSGEASNATDDGRPVLGEELPTPDPLPFWETDLGLTEEEQEDIDTALAAPPPDTEVAAAEVSPTTATTDTEARSRARQGFRRGQRASVSMSASVVGNPELRADTTVRIVGLGQKFSGNYLIEEAVHDVGTSGYTTKLKLKRNATSRSRGTGRTRSRARTEATAALPADADLPFTSTFGWGDCQGAPNNDDAPTGRVDQVADTDRDGEDIVRYQPRTGHDETTMPEPWEEDW
jgi:hypothetical protein